MKEQDIEITKEDAQGFPIDEFGNRIKVYTPNKPGFSRKQRRRQDKYERSQAFREDQREKRLEEKAKQKKLEDLKNK